MSNSSNWIEVLTPANGEIDVVDPSPTVVNVVLNKLDPIAVLDVSEIATTVEDTSYAVDNPLFGVSLTSISLPLYSN